MSNKFFIPIAVLVLLMFSCSEEGFVIDENVITPDTYSFIRSEESTVDFSEQTTIIAMSEELVSALLVASNSEESLDAQFDHEQGENDFIDSNLNSSSISIRAHLANSIDYYPDGEDDSDVLAIKEDFDSWINEQVSTVFANINIIAVEGVAGALAEESEDIIRYIDARGVVLNEFFNTALIGGLMTDQMLNNYLSGAILDNEDNVRDNDEGVLVEGENYTAMEHIWDQAYGSLYGQELDATSPVYGINGGGADSFLNKHLSLLDQQEEFTGIANDVLTAFKLGRAAIVGKNYDVREAQAEIIKEKISIVIGASAIYYLNKGTLAWETDKALAFYNLSKSLGFIYSLQFTRQPFTTSSPVPYFTKEDVDDYISKLLDNGNGLWEDTTLDTVNTIVEDINEAFEFIEEDE